MNKKTDNGRLESKVYLRRTMIEEVYGGANRQISVLDCCAGSERIWRVLRKEFDVCYTGVDIKQMSGRLTANSTAYIKACTRLDFDVIDIDTYGQPWERYQEVVSKLDHECLVFLTDGRRQRAGGGRASNAALDLIGIPRSANANAQVLAAIACEKYVNYCIATSSGHGIITARAMEGLPDSGHGTRYYGVHLTKG